MNADARNPAANGAPVGATGGAALLATFYVERKKKVREKKVADELQNLLCKELILKQYRPGGWCTPDRKEAFLLRFNAAHDATILQVVLNTSGDTAEDWESSRRKLEGILESEFLEGIWGYTLTYQARLNPGIGADEPFEKLKPAAHLLHSDRRAPYKPLSQARVEGGWMWLMAVPTGDDGSVSGNGPAPGTIYVALSEPEEGNAPEKERAIGRLFLGESAGLLMPELIAHKSYYQRRQYRGKRLEEYEGHLDEFRRLVRGLLNELEWREVEPEEITKLARRYHGLAEMVWHLEDLRVSMARQLHNYDEWEATADNAVLQYHRRQIEITNVELELLVSDGQYALSVADPVLSISRYRAERAQEKSEARNDRITQFLLATLAIVVPAALTLPQLIGGVLTAWLIIITVAAVFVGISIRLLWLGARRWLNKWRESHDKR